MCIVFFHTVALNLDLLRRFRCVPVGGNDLILQLLARTLGRQLCRMCANLTRTNPCLILSAAVERQTCREADPVAHLLTRITRL